MTTAHTQRHCQGCRTAQLDGQQHTSDGARFEYEVASLYSVHPVGGPVLGGTSVEVRGAGIAPAGARGLFCQFGTTEAVAATRSSGEVVLCVAPASAGGLPGAVPVRLLGNGAVHGEAAVAYTYRALVEVRRVHPVLGARSGGTLVTLYGAGLVDAGASTRCGVAIGGAVGVDASCTLTDGVSSTWKDSAVRGVDRPSLPLAQQALERTRTASLAASERSVRPAASCERRCAESQSLCRRDSLAARERNACAQMCRR